MKTEATSGTLFDLPAPAAEGTKRQISSPAVPPWRAAWDKDRPAKLASLDRIEKWTVQETAFFLRCSSDHVLNLIYDGTLIALNIARLPTSAPLYRVLRASVLTFETKRKEGNY